MKILSFLILSLGLTLAIFFYAPREVFIPNDCYPQDGPCTVEVDGDSLTLIIDKKMISPVTPITYEVKTNGISVGSAELLLVGKSMHMDQELIQLEKINSKYFKAKRIFPKCEEKEMLWKGVLSLMSDNYTIKTIFNFKVKR